MSKTRMGKRIASLLLSLVMMLSLLPTTVYAAAGTADKNGVSVVGSTAPDAAQEEGVDNAAAGEGENGDVGEDGGDAADSALTTQSGDTEMPVTYAEGKTETDVAKIGETGYATLAGAIEAATDSATITLEANTELTESLTVNTTVTLDLAGRTITGALTIGTNGNLTIDDSADGGKITSADTTITVPQNSNGKLTLNGGTIESTSDDINDFAIETGLGASAVVTINRGTVQNTTNGSAIKLGQNANSTVEVVGGTVQGKQYGIYALQGSNTVKISGGIVSSVGNNFAAYVVRGTKMTVTGGTVGNICYSGSSFSSSSTTSTLTIGTFGGSATDVTIPSVDLDSRYATVYLYSGTVDTFTGFDNMTVPAVGEDRAFLTSTDISGKLPKSEQRCVKDESTGLYYVTSLTVENAAAKVLHDGVETAYNTVGQAVTALQDGDTLTLNTDYTGTIAVQEKNIVIDLGGHTVTATDSQANAVNIAQSAPESNTVTVKNGHLVAKDQSASAIHAIMNDATSETLTLALEDVTLLSHPSAKQSLVRLGNGARTSIANKGYVTNGGLQVVESDATWIYGTTNTAFTHANGGTVTLLNNWYNTDYDGAVRVPEGASYTSAVLDLNGHTIEYYGSVSAIAIGGSGNNYVDGTNTKSLTVKNGAINANSGSGAAIGGSNKTLILDGVTLTTTGTDTTGTDNKYGIFTNGMTTGNTVTLTNSSITAEKGIGIYFPGAGTLTVENTNVTGSVSGIEIRAGVLAVSGDSAITSTAAEFKFEDNDNGSTTTGAAIAAVKHGVGKDLTVNIEGGTFSGLKALYQADPNADKAGTVTMKVTGGTFNGAVTAATVAKFISGGTFTEGVDETYLADGYVYNAADKTVKADTSVAAIGTTKYASLAAAIKAAQNGETVTLLKDITLSSAQSISSKKLTLDLNGKVLNGTGVKTVTLGYEADLTVKDSVGGGKISNAWTKTSGESAAVYLSGTDSQFTLNSGTIESTSKLTSLDSVAIRNKSGQTCTVNINGGSVVVPEAATDGRAIVAGKNMTLNVSGGTIAGGLHGVDAYSGSNVTITGGEITARVVDTGVIKEAYGMRLKGTAKVTVDGGTITGVKMEDNGTGVPNVELKSGHIEGSVYAIGSHDITFTVAPDAEITFANDTVKKFLPDTVELVETPAGTYGVEKAKVYVAKIGDTKYETLKEAIDAANTGATITLLDDVDLGEKSKQMLYSTATDKKDVCNLTFDLNGHKITSSNGSYTVSASREGLVIKNGTIENTASTTKYGAIYATFSTKGTHTLTLENVTVIAKDKGIYTTMTNGNATVTIGDKTVINAKTGIDVVGPMSNSQTCAGSLTLNVSGGTVTGTGCGIHVKGPDKKHATAAVTVNVTGGEVSSITTDSKPSDLQTKVDISGGTVTGDLKNASKDVITITGGTFKGAVTKLDTNGTIAISGGTFSSAVDADLCETGYAPTVNEDGTCTVTKVKVAEVNGTQYDTLEAAIAAAENGNTVKLLADVEQNARLVIDKSITLDLNGKKICNTRDIWNESNALIGIGTDETRVQVTITGSGTIAAKENDCYTIDVKNGDLTIENGEFIGNVSAVQVQTGTLTINGGKFSLLQKWNDKSTYLINCIDGNFADGSAKVAIYGGTFVDFDPNVSPEKKVDGKAPSFAAPGVGITKSGDNFTAYAGRAIQILDENDGSIDWYSSLANALYWVKKGYTVRLLQDYVEVSQPEVKDEVTIDGQGKYSITVEDNGYSYITVSSGKLKLSNVTITGMSNTYSLLYVKNTATITIDKDSKLIANGSEPAIFLGSASDTDSATPTVNIYGRVEGETAGYLIAGNGSYKGTSYINIYDDAVVKAGKLAMFLPQPCEVNITGGTVEGYCAIGIKSGTLNITGGQVLGVAENNELSDNNSVGSGMQYDGSAIVIDSHTGYKGNVNINISGSAFIQSRCSTGIREIGNDEGMTNVKGLSISGGTVLSGGGKDAVQVREVTKKNVSITGGSFSTDVAAYCTIDYQCNPPTEDEPLYTVTKKDADEIDVKRSLTLDNSLTMNYKVKLPSGYENPKVEFEFYDGSVSRKEYIATTVTEYTYNETTCRYVFAFTGINPQRMNDTLKATVYATNVDTQEVTAFPVDDYSVAQYCNALLTSDHNKNGEWDNVIGTLVAYGTASQEYMGYRVTDLVKDAVGNAKTIPDYSTDVNTVNVITGDSTDVKIESRALILSSGFAIRVKFTLADGVNIENVTFTVSGSGEKQTITTFDKGTLSNGTACYYFDFENLNAKQLGTVMTFASSVNGVNSQSLQFNMNAYLVHFITNETTEAKWKALARALYNYGQACAEYGTQS